MIVYNDIKEINIIFYMSQSRKICTVFQKALYEQNGKYTKYQFKIQTTFTKWKINKRYSDFQILHKELLNLSKDKTLPELPSKIFWNKNSELNVSKRSSDLERYLNELINSIFFFPKSPLLDFIEINEEVLSLLKKTQSYFDSDMNGNQLRASFFSNEPSYQSKPLSVYNDHGLSDTNLYNNIFQFNRRKSLKNNGMILVIEEFLRDLDQYKENQGDIVRTFKEFFDEKSKEQQCSIKEIIMLYTGVKQKKIHYHAFKSEEKISISKDDIYLKGILYHIGNYTENILGSTACLEFLENLLSCDKNYDSDRYINLLKSLDNKYLKSMKLNELTKARHSRIRRSGYSIFKILLNYQFEIEKLLNYSDYINLIEAINQNIILNE